MQHCIASYAKRAHQGLCYLFHVEFEGERASVEVNPQGVVLQSQGPRDRPNKATVWGKKGIVTMGPIVSKAYVKIYERVMMWTTAGRRRRIAPTRG
jgi:hypothetical protein